MNKIIIVIVPFLNIFSYLKSDVYVYRKHTSLYEKSKAQIICKLHDFRHSRSILRFDSFSNILYLNIFNHTLFVYHLTTNQPLYSAAHHIIYLPVFLVEITFVVQLYLYTYRPIFTTIGKFQTVLPIDMRLALNLIRYRKIRAVFPLSLRNLIVFCQMQKCPPTWKYLISLARSAYFCEIF